MKDEYRTITAGIAFLVLSPMLLPMVNTEIAPMLYAMIGIAGLIILSAGIAGIMKS